MIKTSCLRYSLFLSSDVEIEIPPETLSDMADVELLEAGIYERPAGSKESIARGAELISNAKTYDV